jgi:hypothetical protein
MGEHLKSPLFWHFSTQTAKKEGIFAQKTVIFRGYFVYQLDNRSVFLFLYLLITMVLA